MRYRIEEEEEEEVKGYKDRRSNEADVMMPARDSNKVSLKCRKMCKMCVKY